MATIDINITIPDDKVDNAKNDFCAYHGFVQNGETRNQFIKRKMREYFKNSIKAYRATISAESARSATITEVEAIEMT